MTWTKSRRLDRYPNLAVDISARLGDLAFQDSAKVRDFFLAYQDRILFGTDVVMRQRPSTMSEEKMPGRNCRPGGYVQVPLRLPGNGRQALGGAASKPKASICPSPYCRNSIAPTPSAGMPA